MKVVLFIGQHKVGSSALQEFLSQNSLALLKAGILYPNVDFQGFAIMLAKAVNGKEEAELLPINAREAQNALAFRMMGDVTGAEMPPYHKRLPSSVQMLHAIRKQVEYLQPEVMLLAAEVFSNFAATAPKAIGRLTRLLEGAEVRIMVTLRRVDEYLVSWHGQRLKFGHRMGPLRDEGVIREYFGSIHFDYRLMLEGWLKAFPNAEVIIRNYSDVLASGGACEDFVKHSGVDFPRALRPAGRSNPSIHRALMEIARVGNVRLMHPDLRQLRNFLLTISHELNLPVASDIEMFGADNRGLLLEHFEPIHNYLGQVTGTSPFFPDIAEVARTAAMPEMEASQVALHELSRQDVKQLIKARIQSDSVKDFLETLSL